MFLRCTKRQRASCPCRYRSPQLHALIPDLPFYFCICQLKLDSPCSQLSVKSPPIHEQALDSLTLTLLLQPHIVSRCSVCSPHRQLTTQQRRSYNFSDNCHITASHRMIQRHLMMPAKVGFPYPHGPLSLCCWYSV